jgi:hypothetical protein
MRIVTSLALIGALATACSDDGSTTTDGASSSSGSTSTTTTPSTDGSVNPTTDPTTGDATVGPTTGEPETSTGSSSDTSTGAVTSLDTTGSTGVESTGSTGVESTGSTGVESTGSTGMPDLCANGVLDQDETDVDCGGATCADCEDGKVCLANEDCVSVTCANGLCITPECLADADCVMLDDACNTGTCDLGTFACVKTPVMDATVCDDEDMCTGASACQAGACVGTDPTDCTDLDSSCGTGVCDPVNGTCGVQPVMDSDGMACDDANGCTANTVCAAGYCGDPLNKGYVFHEDFSDPAPGWMLDTNWEIGPALVSPAGEGSTGTDPALDHTATDDNKLAGQLIGALITDQTTPVGSGYRCLTTPKVDAAAMPTAWVTFWRHLHSDYTNFAIQRIEVWNGAQWVLLEQGYASPVSNDAQWKEIKFDISAHKNKDLQVRICHNRNQGGAYTYGGWSVDDLTISPVSCNP